MRPETSLKIHAPGAPAASGRAGGVWRRADGSVCGRSFVHEERRWIEWDDLGRFEFSANGSHAVEAWPSAPMDAAAIGEAYTREIEPIVLQATGCQALHASAVAGRTGVIGFCGASGAGKSTFAYAMRGDGFMQFADDHLVVTVSGARIQAWSRPFQPSLRPASASYFRTTGQPDRPAASALPLAAIVILEPDTALPHAFRIDPLPATRAFTALLPHAHCFDPCDRAELERLSNDYLTLVTHVRVARLQYRPSFTSLPDVVEALRSWSDAPAEG